MDLGAENFGIIVISCFQIQSVWFKFSHRKVTYLACHYVLLALSSWRKESTDGLFFIYWTQFLVSFFSFLLISFVECKSSSLSEIYGLLKEWLNEEHH